VPDFEDYDLHDASAADLVIDVAPKPPSPLRWVIPIALVIGVALGGYLFLQRREVASTTPGAQQAAAPRSPAVERPVAAPVNLPPLDQSDALVTGMVRALSTHPAVLTWLATPGLIRNATVVAVGIADGNAPSAQLRALRPPGRFTAIDSAAGAQMDRAAYSRYDLLTAAIGSADPAGVARAYLTLKPLFDEAHRDLGYPDTPFDRTLERAIVRLLETPVLPERVALRGRGGLFAFADPRLEGLSAAQKQLLRFGPRNVERVQQSLRAFALAAGIPADRLPRPAAPG
jgi:hypothetical protein